MITPQRCLILKYSPVIRSRPSTLRDEPPDPDTTRPKTTCHMVCPTPTIALPSSVLATDAGASRDLPSNRK